MRICLNPGDSITAVMSGAVTATAPAVSVETVDSKTLRMALNGTTAVTLLTAPDHEKAICTGLSIYNADTTASTITIKHVVGGTSYTITKVALQADETLVIGPSGIAVITSAGNLKVSQVAGTGDLSMDSAGQIVDSNGAELIQFPSAVTDAVNELTISNAATGNSPSIAASGGDTDINITLTPKGAGFNLSNGPFQVRDSVAVTATVGGGTTGLIPAGSSLVVVTSDNADKQISLPAASVGDEIEILVGSTACELISAVATHKVNDVLVGATNELALTAESLYRCKYVATDKWVVTGLTKLGAAEAALVPDAL